MSPGAGLWQMIRGFLVNEWRVHYCYHVAFDTIRSRGPSFPKACSAEEMQISCESHHQSEQRRTLYRDMTLATKAASESISAFTSHAEKARERTF